MWLFSLSMLSTFLPFAKRFISSHVKFSCSSSLNVTPCGYNHFKSFWNCSLWSLHYWLLSLGPPLLNSPFFSGSRVHPSFLSFYQIHTGESFLKLRRGIHHNFMCQFFSDIFYILFDYSVLVLGICCYYQFDCGVLPLCFIFVIQNSIVRYISACLFRWLLKRLFPSFLYLCFYLFCSFIHSTWSGALFLIFLFSVEK